MTTPRDILVAAFGYSSKNRPDQITARSDELFEVVMRAMRALYTFAAEINPEYFGVQETINYASGGWTHPALAESVYYIENAAGREVVVVPRSQRDADLARPSIWKLGRRYFSAANSAIDPTTGSLVVFYSKRAEKPADIDTAFDASWPTDHDPLLVLETAMYLAINDNRTEEAAALVADRDRAARRFVAHLEHENTSIVMSYGNTRTYNVPNLMQSLLVQVPS